MGRCHSAREPSCYEFVQCRGVMYQDGRASRNRLHSGNPLRLVVAERDNQGRAVDQCVEVCATVAGNVFDRDVSLDACFRGQPPESQLVRTGAHEYEAQVGKMCCYCRKSTDYPIVSFVPFESPEGENRWRGMP